METKKTPAVTLLLDSARGVYIPSNFASGFRMDCKGGDTYAGSYKGISIEEVNILKAGPEHAEYWDTWNDVLENAYFEHEGDKYTLHHDGDLWLLCIGRMTGVEKANFWFDEN